jgi:hypothetical protein
LLCLWPCIAYCLTEDLGGKIVSIMMAENNRLGDVGLRWEQPDGWTQQTEVLMLLTWTPERVACEQANPHRRKVTQEYPPARFLSVSQSSAKATGLPCHDPFLGLPPLPFTIYHDMATLNWMLERLGNLSPEQSRLIEQRSILIRASTTVAAHQHLMAHLNQFNPQLGIEQMGLLVPQLEPYSVIPPEYAARLQQMQSGGGGRAVRAVAQLPPPGGMVMVTPMQASPVCDQASPPASHGQQAVSSPSAPQPQSMGEPSSAVPVVFCAGCGKHREDPEGAFCAACGRQYA